MLSINLDLSLDQILEEDRLLKERYDDAKNERGFLNCDLLKEMSLADPDEFRMRMAQFGDEEITERYIRSNPEVSFKIDDTPRAVGLWLWDFMQENDCGEVSKAKDAFKQTFDYIALGFDSKEDRQYRRLVERTEDCIAKPEVMTMGNRKADTKK